MARFETNDLDDLHDELLELDEEIPFFILFSESFMLSHTRFSSIAAFLEAGGFHAKTDEEFDAIPDADLDAYVEKESDFSSWEEMLGEAVEEYQRGQLGI